METNSGAAEPSQVGPSRREKERVREVSWMTDLHSLIGSGKIDRAAIFSAAGDSAWAASPAFQVLLTSVVKWADLWADERGGRMIR